MAAPKIDYQEEFFEGMTAARLAQLFRLDRRTVVEKLRPIRPHGERRGAPIYHVADAAPYLVDPIVDIEKYLQEMGPGDLPAALQSTYWAAQNSKLKYKENSKQLWRTQAVSDMLMTAFRSLSQSLRLLADRVEAHTGLTAEQRTIIEREISDKAINTIRKRLIEDFSIYSGVNDKEQLADLTVTDMAEAEGDDDE